MMDEGNVYVLGAFTLQFIVVMGLMERHAGFWMILAIILPFLYLQWRDYFYEAVGVDEL